MEVKLNHKEHVQQLLGIIALGFLAVTYVFYYFDNTERASLLQRAETVAAALSREEVSALTGTPADETSVSYQAVKRKLHRIVVANPDLRFAYLTAQKGNDIVFLVDSEDPASRDYSPPGQVYEEASELFIGAFAGNYSFVEGPVRDQWGYWISALVPIVSTSTNRVVAIVGVDVGAYGYVSRLIAYSLLPVLITIFLVYYAVSSRRLAEKAKENVELRSEFIAIASHELRSPITGIKWALQSFVEGAQTLDAKQTKVITGVLHNTERLLMNVNDILEFAALEKGAITTLNRETRNLYGIVKETVDGLQFAAKEKEIAVTLEGEWPTMGDEISCDKNRLRMAFANVLSNAIKYSPEKTEVVLVRSASHGDITISVQDNGIGIPRDDQQGIFTEFFRSTNAVKNVPNGTGLGLYYTKSIVEAHGGKIWFESEEGKGTTFYLKLPRA